MALAEQRPLWHTLEQGTYFGVIHPSGCRFYTASNPEMNSIFVLSIKFKVKFKQRYEKCIQNTTQYERLMSETNEDKRYEYLENTKKIINISVY